jgi:hypothetical protein
VSRWPAGCSRSTSRPGRTLSTETQNKGTIILFARLLSEATLLSNMGRSLTARPPRRSESAGALSNMGRSLTARPPRRSESAGAPPDLLRGPVSPLRAVIVGLEPELPRRVPRALNAARGSARRGSGSPCPDPSRCGAPGGADPSSRVSWANRSRERSRRVTVRPKALPPRPQARSAEDGRRGGRTGRTRRPRFIPFLRRALLPRGLPPSWGTAPDTWSRTCGDLY